MRRSLALWAAVTISPALGGCFASPAPAPTVSNSAPAPTPSASPTPSVSPTPDPSDGVAPPSGYFGGSTAPPPALRVFDFAELAGFSYYCDSCTVDSMIEEFGRPTRMFGTVDGIPNTWVEIQYPKTTFELTPAGEGFSFELEENIGSGVDYPLTEQDRVLPLVGLSMTTTDSAFPLPRGLKIGTSTREEVLAAYPNGSAWRDENGDSGDRLEYVYAWFSDLPNARSGGDFGEPGITYEFRGTLSSVRVNWRILQD